MPPVKRANSIDVARQAGVSRTTVSFVLNNVPDVTISDSTRKRVLEAARSLNYHPNAAGRKLVSGKSRTLGLVLCQSPEQVSADALLPQVLLGVEQAAIQQGYQVLLKPVEPNAPLGYTKIVNENFVDGILLSGPRENDQEIIRLHEDGFPVMLMGQLPDSSIPFVDIDASAGAETAAKHLIECGHRRIAMITNAPLTFTSAQQRRDGYARALEESGLAMDESLVKEGNYTPASGYAAMTELLALSSPPTAIFVASDVVAMGAMLAAKRAGLCIPRDLALVGFDDIPLAEYFDPPLTTVHLPAFGLGLAGGERLIRLIQNEGLDEEAVLMQSELIIRESA
ncbi:MAG: LacI family DNA-binding transcriptional regulator [Chloroflexi bacterium]|nr:LacI family DNA-binding transcriptional regulator [Chloroflexota bacterium]